MASIDLTADQAKAIGQRMQAARKMAGFARQADLAEAMNLSMSYISKLEAGDNIPKDDSIYRRISTVLECQLHWLLTGESVATKMQDASVTPAVHEESEPYSVRPPRSDRELQAICDLLFDDAGRQAIETIAKLRGIELWQAVKQNIRGEL